jgi:hypothetical protein
MSTLPKSVNRLTGTALDSAPVVDLLSHQMSGV